MSDGELTSLIRATNDNDVDNGLSSWTGRCCRKKRIKVQEDPEVRLLNHISHSVNSAPVLVQKALTHPLAAPSASVVGVPRLLSVSASPTPFAHAASIHKGPQHKVAPSSNLEQSINLVDSSSESGGESTASDSDFQEPVVSMESQRNLERSNVRRPDSHYPLVVDVDISDRQQPHEAPLPSTSTARLVPSSSVDVPSTYSHCQHLSNSSLVPPILVLDHVHFIDGHVLQIYSRKSTTSRPVEPRYAHVTSRLTNDPCVLGSSEPSISGSMDIDPPTLNLHDLSLNRNKASSQLLRQVIAARPPSPPQPISVVESEDDEMEDLYGPPVGLPSPYAPPPPHPHAVSRGRSPSLRYPAEEHVLPPPAVRDPPPPRRELEPKSTAEHRMLPALVADDPSLLGMLERQEQREAARPRQGMSKATAVRRAGKKRGGFIFLADRTEAEVARAEQTVCRVPRGRFASYFAHLDV